MRRKRRTKEDWNTVFVSQLSSGLTANEYCAKHNIHFKNFSAHKSDINKKKHSQVDSRCHEGFTLRRCL